MASRDLVNRKFPPKNAVCEGGGWGSDIFFCCFEEFLCVETSFLNLYSLSSVEKKMGNTINFPLRGLSIFPLSSFFFFFLPFSCFSSSLTASYEDPPFASSLEIFPPFIHLCPLFLHNQRAFSSPLATHGPKRFSSYPALGSPTFDRETSQGLFFGKKPPFFSLSPSDPLYILLT